MKKTLAIILSLVLCASCLFGCGGGVEKKAQKSAPDSDDVTITVWSTEAGAQVAYEELVSEWNATEGDEKNIFIDWVTTTDGTQIDVAQQSGQLPHLFNVSGNQRAKFIEQGDVLALDDLPGGKEFIEEFAQPGIEGQTLVDGKTYGVQPNVKTAALAYNKDLFKQAGIVDKNGEPTPPETLEELREYAKKITALGNGIYGFAFPLKFGLSYTVAVQQGSYYNNNVEEKASSWIDLDNLTVDCSGYKDIYQWLLDMKKDGSIFPGAETLDNDTARAYFAAGTIGMIPAISWDVAVYNDQFKAECDWDICQYPSVEGKEVVHHWNQRGGMRLIGKKAAEKNPEETMEVIKFLYSKELRAELFERGINLSSKRDVLEIVDESKIDPRFLKFGEFVDEETRYATSESYIVEGDNWETLFQKVWMGSITLDEAIADYEARATAGLKKAVSRGEYDVQRQKRVRRYLLGEDGVDITMTH